MNLPEQKKSVKFYVGSAPQALIQETLRMREEQLQKTRSVLLGELNRIQFKYYCSICLIIRDENEYLAEWLQWHLKQGVQHFYIYDHESKQSVKEFIQTLGAEIYKKITVIEWFGSHKDAQPEAYNDCLKRFRTESRWIGFVDADEQVRVKTEQTLPEFLEAYEDFAGVFANWILYDANGQIKQTDEPLRKRFTHVNIRDAVANKMGKVFVQPILMREMVIHNGSPERGFEVVDEHKKTIPPYSLINKEPTADLICVDHYYTKSYEEWVKKIKRGCAHAKFLRRYDEFFKYNPDLESCREYTAIKQQYEHSEK